MTAVTKKGATVVKRESAKKAKESLALNIEELTKANYSQRMTVRPSMYHFSVYTSFACRRGTDIMVVSSRGNREDRDWVRYRFRS